jgi:hypothetical protein
VPLLAAAEAPVTREAAPETPDVVVPENTWTDPDAPLVVDWPEARVSPPEALLELPELKTTAPDVAPVV